MELKGTGAYEYMAWGKGAPVRKRAGVLASRMIDTRRLALAK